VGSAVNLVTAVPSTSILGRSAPRIVAMRKRKKRSTV
jgi:hypothetical protein